MSQEEINSAIEVIPNRLYYMSVTKKPQDSDTEHFFCTDEIFRYYNYFLDFGPLNISQIYQFCVVVDLKLRSSRFKNKKLYYYSRQNPKLKINSILLIASFYMVSEQLTAEEAFSPFKDVELPFYHDASPYECDFKLTVKDCLCGLEKAIKNQFIDFKHFDYEAYDHYERFECGDMNWVVRDHIIAFSGPQEVSEEIDGVRTLVPEDYLPNFKTLNVGTVIRLNRPSYNSKRFTQHGIHHYELYFPDGGLPEFTQLLRFIAIVKSSKQAIAVHCKAGLGRTGTVICAYLMYEGKMTAEEAIGYCRLCRPGSVVGCQQHYLKRIEAQLKQCTEKDILESLTAKRSPIYEVQPRRRASSSYSKVQKINNEIKKQKDKPIEKQPTVTKETKLNVDKLDQGSSLYNRKVAKTNVPSDQSPKEETKILKDNVDKTDNVDKINNEHVTERRETKITKIGTSKNSVGVFIICIIISVVLNGMSKEYVYILLCTLLLLFLYNYYKQNYSS